MDAYSQVLKDLGAGKRIIQYRGTLPPLPGFEVDTAHPTGRYDVFLSIHAIEDVPSVPYVIEMGMGWLKPGGLFVAFTVNGSETRRKADLKGWRKDVSQHPQVIDEAFLQHCFAGKPLVIASSPYPSITLTEGHTVGDLSGKELMFATRVA